MDEVVTVYRATQLPATSKQSCSVVMNEDTETASILFCYIKLKSKQQWTGEQEGGKERCSMCGYCKYLAMSTELFLGRIRLNTSLSRICAPLLSCSLSLTLSLCFLLYVSVSISLTLALSLSLSFSLCFSRSLCFHPFLTLSLLHSLCLSVSLSISLSLSH